MMFLVYLAMLLEPMAVLATTVTQFQSNLAGFRPCARPAGRAASEMADCPRHARYLLQRRRLWCDHDFCNVGFIYPGTSRRVLREINLEVEPGEINSPLRGPKRIGQDHALQLDRSILRPNRRHDRTRWA